MTRYNKTMREALNEVFEKETRYSPKEFIKNGNRYCKGIW